jgi:hypothetical protein
VEFSRIYTDTARAGEQKKTNNQQSFLHIIFLPMSSGASRRKNPVPPRFITVRSHYTGAVAAFKVDGDAYDQSSRK